MADVQPHRLRWWILLLLFLAITVNVLDRQVLSLVAPVLRDQLHLSNSDYGFMVFCFLLGMTLGQIPVGILMDRFGARRGFAWIIAWWSSASLLHAFARSMTQFGVFRLLLGLGECGTYSGGVKVIGQWFPQRERALAAGLFNSGSLAGAVLAPPAIVFLTLKFGWPAAFLLPSGVGILWLIPWLKLYWDPWKHPRLTAKEHEQARQATVQTTSAVRTRFLPLLSIRAVWGVILMRAFGGPVTHFYWYWLPEYLKHERGMSLEMIGLFAWMPFFSGGVGNIGGGWFSSWMIQHGCSVDRARKTAIILAVALALPAVLVPASPSTLWAMALICLASLGINALAANQMALLTDLFPQEILARVSGLTGVGDSGVSMVVMLLTGVVVDHFSYYPVFIAAGVFPLVSLIAFLVLVRSVRPVQLSEAVLMQSSR
jgi:ACS family hexuronate transporter-like MFS transporter